MTQLNIQVANKALFTQETVYTQSSVVLSTNVNSTYLCYTAQIKRKGSPTTAFQLPSQPGIILDKTPYKSDNNTKLVTLHIQ